MKIGKNNKLIREPPISIKVVPSSISSFVAGAIPKILPRYAEVEIQIYKVISHLVESWLQNLPYGTLGPEG